MYFFYILNKKKLHNFLINTYLITEFKKKNKNKNKWAISLVQLGQQSILFHLNNETRSNLISVSRKEEEIQAIIDTKIPPLVEIITASQTASSTTTKDPAMV